MVHLHAHSWYSFLAASSPPEALAQRAADLGHPALAATDDWTVGGAVAHAAACKKYGLRPVHGAYIEIDDIGITLLAANTEGYATLCDLLTLAHRDRDNVALTWEQFQEFTEGLFCLADFRRPIATKEFGRAGRRSILLQRQFRDRFFIELIHHERPGDALLLRHCRRLAKEIGSPNLASNAVRFANKTDFQLYDALVCIKHHIPAAAGHSERPVNDAAFLCDEKRFIRLCFPQDSIANTEAIARECDLDLLAPVVTPPETRVPEGYTAATYLRHLCRSGFRQRYPQGSEKAVAQLKKELRIIGKLELEEFFLAVNEVMAFARSRNIICSGRGSAANSIVAYLLEITNVDPIEHKLLFERFLHEGRRGMPDIDCDFPSDRRDEVIEWMHQRWSEEHTAMTANLVTFRLRSAVQDVAKTLGYTPALINKATSLLPRGHCRDIRQFRPALARALGESPALDLLCSLVERMEDCPNYLGLHSGGMILSRRPLRYLSAIQTSAKGVRQIQFNKDDVERRGEIKFDVLALRALAVIAEAVAHVNLTQDEAAQPFDYTSLPLDDPSVYDLICSGATLGLFQVESPGQWHLLSQTQPRDFFALVVQVALFRPGPLQSGMVAPFVAACRGITKPRFLHPSLKSILEDTYGIILFQEQVLEVAHQFAGMSLQEADEFRRLMSRFRDATEMEAMRESFVLGAMKTHNASKAIANKVFDIVSAYVGYGFCRSHAASFAHWVYITAYLKTHYPVQYLAAVMEHKPGFWPMQSFVEEARHNGIETLPVSLDRSEVKFSMDYDDKRALAIRIPFTQINGITAESAAEIVLERAITPFRSLADAVHRVSLNIGQWENLAKSGALDMFGSRRDVLWQVREHMKEKVLSKGNPDQLTFEMESITAPPPLTPLEVQELIDWDFLTQHLTPEKHPLNLHRQNLMRLGVKAISDLRCLPPKTVVRVAGSVISRQRPPTAKGMVFIVLEDESGRLPTAVTPQVYEKYASTLHEAGLVLEGKLEVAPLSDNTYRSVLVERAWSLSSLSRQIIIGAAGFPGEQPRFPMRKAPAAVPVEDIASFVRT